MKPPKTTMASQMFECYQFSCLFPEPQKSKSHNVWRTPLFEERCLSESCLLLEKKDSFHSDLYIGGLPPSWRGASSFGVYCKKPNLKKNRKGTHKTLLLFGAYSRSRYKELNPMALAVANDILNDGKGQLLSKECRIMPYLWYQNWYQSKSVYMNKALVFLA